MAETKAKSVRVEQETLVQLVPRLNLAAHCPNCPYFNAACPACQSMPNWCDDHRGYRPGTGESDPVGECPKCQRLRPGFIEFPPTFEMVVSAEEAFGMFGLPKRLLKRGREILIPWRRP